MSITNDTVFIMGVPPITTAPTAPLLDPNLSSKAKGIIGIIAALRSAKLSDILSHTKDGRDGTLTGINELIDAGYLSVMESRKSGGTFAGTRYFIDWTMTPQPPTKSPQQDSPLPENPDAVENMPIYYNIKLHSPDPDGSNVLTDSVEEKSLERVVPKDAGKLPKTDAKLVQYLKTPDPSKYIDDITSEYDLATLRHVYGESAWQHRYSEALWMIAHTHSLLTVPQWMKRKLVLQKWADEFDKVIRTGKGTEEQLKLVMVWLTEVDTWWIANGNFASPAKFHEKYAKDGHNNRFDYFLHRALQAAPKIPSPRKIFNPNEIDTILKWYKHIDRDDFKKMSDTKFMYMPEQKNADAVESRIVE